MREPDACCQISQPQTQCPQYCEATDIKPNNTNFSQHHISPISCAPLTLEATLFTTSFGSGADLVIPAANSACLLSFLLQFCRAVLKSLWFWTKEFASATWFVIISPCLSSLLLWCIHFLLIATLPLACSERYIMIANKLFFIRFQIWSGSFQICLRLVRSRWSI